MAKIWLSESKKFSVIDQYAGRDAAATTSFRRRGFNTKRGSAACEETAGTKTDAISWFSFEGRSLPPATTWSGYGCKPAARLTRSASLLMTQRKFAER